MRRLLLTVFALVSGCAYSEYDRQEEQKSCDLAFAASGPTEYADERFLVWLVCSRAAADKEPDGTRIRAGKGHIIFP